jgi:hypothetical protein
MKKFILSVKPWDELTGKGLPDQKYVRRYNRLRIDGWVFENGKRALRIHKLKGSFWIWSEYELAEDGQMTFLRKGKYPDIFVRRI